MLFNVLKLTYISRLVSAWLFGQPRSLDLSTAFPMAIVLLAYARGPGRRAGRMEGATPLWPPYSQPSASRKKFDVSPSFLFFSVSHNLSLSLGLMGISLSVPLIFLPRSWKQILEPTLNVLLSD